MVEIEPRGSLHPGLHRIAKRRPSVQLVLEKTPFIRLVGEIAKNEPLKVTAVYAIRTGGGGKGIAAMRQEMECVKAGDAKSLHSHASAIDQALVIQVVDSRFRRVL